VSVALLDANVLYPAPLRDFLLRLATARLFTPQWSDEIQDEWTRNLLANRDDLTAEQINRTRNLMDKAFPDACVTGYEGLIPTLTNDPKDRHVLAAAITSGAAQIVTFNIKDFPEASLSPYGIQAVRPDSFALTLYQESPAEMLATLRTHRLQLTRPPKTAEEYLDTLAQNHLTQTVDALQKHLSEI
jgi:predicted nucleic acid-binding protein